MKVVSKEEEQAHYSTVLRGGAIGGALGVSVGLAGVMFGMRRYQGFRSLTLPFRSFLVTSTGTFGAIVNAERHSNAFHLANNPMNFYKDEAQLAIEAADAQRTAAERLQDWGRRNRYTIVFSSWAASMALALAIVGRNRYLSTSQKLVQARMYAQGLSLGVLVATAALETADAKSGSGRWEVVKVLDPNDPEHKHLVEKRVHKEEYEGQDLWKDMVAAEERRIAARQNGSAGAGAGEGKGDGEKKN
ncbi:Replication factor C, subunit RFC4 [Diatrype stigma]|uniref:Replication factor C, subunit RFC4 n=1 Tax=Diatrype stigma TaxID=117547 RepID=A0AAN9UP48_9PEZI